jgi:uncharacterized protein DUF1579
MKICLTHLARGFVGIAVITFASAVCAQDPKGSASTAPSPVLPPGTTTTSSPTTTDSAGGAGAPAGMPSQEEMMKMMMENSKVTDNHKLLTSLDGTWNYTVKMWMDPNAKPQESKGVATRKSVMGGRFVVMDVNGKFMMPGPDGKMKEMDFKGQGIEGYDNAKKKFVGTWMDNMGTGIMNSEGDYDPATKSFTFTSKYTMAPGVDTPIREVVKLTDKDHMTFEWYESHGGPEMKTMEINYTRSGKK